MGCSRISGPFLVTDYMAEPHFLGYPNGTLISGTTCIIDPLFPNYGILLGVMQDAVYRQHQMKMNHKERSVRSGVVVLPIKPILVRIRVVTFKGLRQDKTLTYRHCVVT